MASEDSGIFIRKLEQLVSVPRESLSCEIKGWIVLTDKSARANLAQALLALANHGGGYVLLGFAESGGVYKPAPNRPTSLEQYDQDSINGIVARYADPAFHCEVHQVTRREDGQPYPVIVVPGGHPVPVRAKRSGPDEEHVRQNTYYIRQPGPKSAPPASARDWDELIRRCIRNSREELMSEFRTILDPKQAYAGWHESPQGSRRLGA